MASSKLSISIVNNVNNISDYINNISDYKWWKTKESKGASCK